MCLIAFDWQPSRATPLQLLANRDEFYARPTQGGHFWSEATAQSGQVFGGKDLQAGGSWLAVSGTRRLAAVTNFRQSDLATGALSRGDLVADYICGQKTALEFLQQLHQRAQSYGAFNLLLLDKSELFYYSNREGKIRQLKPGLYGLCNHLLDTPWPKLTRLKQQLKVKSFHLDLLQDNHQPLSHELPDTGVGPEFEQLLSTIFIQSENYGTRCSTRIELGQEGWLWQEQNYGPFGKQQGPELTMRIPLLGDTP